MDELKTRSFRLSEEVTEKIKNLANEINGSQQDVIAKLIETYEFQNSKSILTSKKNEITKFEEYTTVLTRMFMNNLEETEHINESVHMKFEAQLNSKDSLIKDLQEKLKNLTLSNKECVENTKVANNDKVILQEKLSNLETQHNEKILGLENQIKDKNSLNSALTENFNKLKNELDLLKITQDETNKIFNQNKDLLGQVDNLERELEMLKQQFKLEQEKLQLDLEKKYQKEKQEEINKYQQKYFELLDKQMPQQLQTTTSKKPTNKKVITVDNNNKL